MSKPNRQLIKAYLLILLNEVKSKPKTAMTTEEVGEALVKSVERMSPLEKAKLRRIIRREFRQLELFDPRKLVN